MDYTVTFVHPSSGARMEAAINPELTADEVIQAIVEQGFIAAPSGNLHYSLHINGGEKVEGSTSLREGGIREGSEVLIVATGGAG